MRPRPEPLTPTSVISRKASELRAAETAREAARTPAGGPVRWFVRLVVELVHKADRDRMLGLAAETAFFAVLTLFPALLVSAAVLGQLSVFIGERNAARVENGVIEFLDTVLTDTAGPAIETARDLFEGSGGILTFASLLALVSLSTAFATLINTVNITYDVPETRGWWRRRLLGLLLGAGTVLVGALAVTLIVIGPLFGAGEDAVVQVGLDRAYSLFWSWVRWPLAFVALVVWATTMDHFAPATRSPWRYDLPGGLLTAVLWLAASYGLNVYVRTVVTSSPVFGALGGGLILMTWVYLLTVALLAGGELNAILQARRRYRAEVRARAVVHESGVHESGVPGPAVQGESEKGEGASAAARRAGSEQSGDAPRTVELDPPLRESEPPVVLRPRGRG